MLVLTFAADVAVFELTLSVVEFPPAGWPHSWHARGSLFQLGALVGCSAASGISSPRTMEGHRCSPGLRSVGDAGMLPSDRTELEVAGWRVAGDRDCAASFNSFLTL